METDHNEDPSELPTVSGPAPESEGAFLVPPPQIQGYEIVEHIGAAGQGRVWRALQLSTHREVALKVPRVDLLRSRKALARFEREVELAARLNHPNIAQIYDSGVYQGLYYYAMELIAGRPLDDYVRQHKLSTRQILELMRIICEAVQHAHQNGVIHRDIKPSNIVVTDDSQPHVVDFGVATCTVGDDTFKTLSAEGEMTGTPAYMSPEQAGGYHERLDTRTDVYSLGVVFYELLTGRFPYEVRTSMLETLRNIRETDPARPSTAARHLDRDVEAIVLKALAKEPDQRYQSVAELKSDINRRLAGMPILARSDSSLYLLRKIIARHRYTSTVAALLLVIVMSFFGVCLQLIVELGRTNRQLEEQRELLSENIGGFARHAELVVFAEFLDHWHGGGPQQASLFAKPFAHGTREAQTIRFLQDDRPLSEKIEAFRQRLQPSEPCFVEFVIAEHYLRDGRTSEAANAYRACLTHAGLAKEDPWFVAWVRNRLYELAGQDESTQVLTSGGGSAR